MRLSLLLVAFALAPCTGWAQVSAADSAAIRAAALDYALGWYAGDGDRMARALHPALAKRLVHDTDSLSLLRDMDFDALVGATRQGIGTRTPEIARRADVRLLDTFGNAAVVRLDMTEWVDYLHLARWNGGWKIVNVLWAIR